MNFGHKTLAWLLVLGIVLMFFFPLSFGSFQSTHGPTTTVNAAASNPVVTLLIVAVALALALTVANRDRAYRQEPDEVPVHRLVVRELICSLRC